ncbi:hypothetical protein MDOR_01060 [Mycolicibacterium doricum]|uniref:Carboxyltransferase domain-containing protein n=1 Tax=Mycolicibacterium doricum TaxID=126673 RepID=A0A1X1SXT4_9MYCO|nr:hypothetical protein [Mycolicibacterium doricum]MCV7267615.1 hypothetical protein [Mycolicibacterium doricum]ORV35901.1 hypothetical protein AWC01_17915 [Mycolicibacterium doricum]BBZ05937.1 hypothetical protein MDOR_01060 [Mycolicibacterium doricum]
MTALEILSSGPLALVEDIGRPELAHLGVARSGAADRRAHGLMVPGPRDDWFVDPDILVRTNRQVTTRSDRVGTRLVGMPLDYRWPDRQLPSEGATRGAIRCPPTDCRSSWVRAIRPQEDIVIGVVADHDVDRASQAPARVCGCTGRGRADVSVRALEPCHRWRRCGR